MKHLCIVLFFLFTATVAFAQTGTLAYTLTVIGPDPSCTLRTSSQLDFGTHTRSSSGTDSDDAAGEFTLTGTDVSEYEVSVALPMTFPNLDVDLDLGWSQSTTGRSSSWTAISGSTYTGTAGGLWTDLTRYFQISGRASWDWADIISAEDDRFTVDVTVSCTRTS